MPKQRVGVQRIVLIRVQKPRNKPISCIGQDTGGGIPSGHLLQHLQGGNTVPGRVMICLPRDNPVTEGVLGGVSLNMAMVDTGGGGG